MKKTAIILNAVLLACAVLFAWHYFASGQPDVTDFNSLSVYTAPQSELLSGKTSSEQLISVKLQNRDIPFDSSADVHYISYDKLGECKIEHEQGVKIYLTEPLDPETAAAKMMKNEPYTLLAVSQGRCQIYRLGLTSLPMIDLKILEKHDKEKPVKERNTLGEMTVYNTAAELPTVESTFTQLKIRGGTSREYPQKSYSVSFVGEDLQPRAMSFFGFREQTAYDLLTIYEDSSKIRDKLSGDLWNQFGAGSNARGIDNGFHTEFVEVFIDDTYWGIYLISEKVDETLLQLGEGDTLYKVFGNSAPTARDILKLDGNSMKDDADSVELKYPRSFKKGNWLPLYDYMRDVYYSDDETFRALAADYADMDNIVDMWIFLNVVSGRDNIWKNTYFSNTGEKTMLMTPWDFDLTFGAGWLDEGNLHVWFNPETTDMRLDFVIGNRYLENDIAGMKQKLRERWLSVRDGVFSSESITAQAQTLYSRLQASGALLRFGARWVDGAQAQGIDEIIEWIPQRLDYVDRLVDEICGQEG